MKAIIEQLRVLDEIEYPANQLGLPNYYQFIADRLSIIIEHLTRIRDSLLKQSNEFYQV